ncbi:MAG: M28 family peptidase [Oliverpabstia sp.]
MANSNTNMLRTELLSHLQQLCTDEKLSGSPAAANGAAYISRILDAFGISNHTYTFPAFLSNPVESQLLISEKTSDSDRDNHFLVKSRPRSFSMNCPDGVTGELVYDPYVADDIALCTRQDFLKQVRGKLVLGFGYDEKYAKLLEQYGALGWIQIWKTDEEEIHEDTVGTIWGIPDLESVWSTLHLPVAAINGPDGKALIRRLNNGEHLSASLKVTVDTHVEDVILPTAFIKGTTDDFILLSGHYDTWYTGAMDNGSSNAILLELTKTFHRISQKTPLTRGLCIAWWPGHSNGRYMGSTWYADHFHQELRRHCIAHINSDLTGSLYADVLAVRSTGLEGSDFHCRIAASAGLDAPAIWGKIGRGADQSFWGERIPYHIAVRYERLPENKESAAPGAGVWWWHTRYDTPDKVNPDVMIREYSYLEKLLDLFLKEPYLPVNITSYFSAIEEELDTIMRNRASDLQKLKGFLKVISTKLIHLQDTGKLTLPLLKETIGRINCLRQSYGSEHGQDLAFFWGTFPLLSAGSYQTETCPTDWKLFMETTYIRQYNRMLDTLTEIIEKLETKENQQ